MRIVSYDHLREQFRKSSLDRQGKQIYFVVNPAAASLRLAPSIRAACVHPVLDGF